MPDRFADDFREVLGPWRASHAPAIESTIERLVPCGGLGPDRLLAAMRHSLFAGGKRLRPLLVMAASEAGGSANPDAARECASAIEMVHTFSLIHDDLPALDNDDLRRGVPTCHIAYGEDIAILAGDALLVRAFEVLADLPGVSPDQRVRCIAAVASACGPSGMVGGQVDDLGAEGRPLGADELASIHDRKTAALLRASVVAGGIVGGTDSNGIAALETYATRAGLAFQIVDDILDITSDAQTLGKPAGSDLRHDKATYPKLYGLELSRKMADEAIEDAIAALSVFGAAARPLGALARYIVARHS